MKYSDARTLSPWLRDLKQNALKANVPVDRNKGANNQRRLRR